MSSMLLTRSTLSLACITLLSSAAWAQAADVVITGSARAQRVLDAPFAITAIDATALRDAGPMVNLSEVMAQVPGVVVNNRNNYAQDLQISSRGFGARAAFGVRGLRLYADGIPATMPDGQGQVAHFDLAGAQRIEVLRGPFSVLYGSNSGGVIALFTAPVKAGVAEVGLDVGSFGLRQGRISVAAPLGQVAGGALDLRASLGRMDLDGFRPQSAADRQLGHVRLGWQGGRDALTVQLSDHEQSAQDPLGLTAAQFAADPRQTTPQALQYNTRKTIAQTQGGVNWRHQFAGEGALRESSVTLYQGTRAVTQWQSIPSFVQVDERRPGGVVDFDRDYGGVEGKLSLLLGATDLAVGLSVETQQDDRRGFENFLPGPPAVLGVTGRQRRDETNRDTTTEGFVQAQMPVAERLTVTGGLRGGRVEMSTHDRYIVGLNGDDSGELSYSFVNPVLGLRWAVSPGWVVHASAARGFESPTLGELAYRADGAGGFNVDLQPQKSRQIELGSKWRGGGLSVDAAVFAVNTDNEIGVLSNIDGRSVFQSVGRTQRRGAELALGWAINSRLRLQAAAAWLDAEYRDAFGPTTARVQPGNQLPGTQRSSAWAQAAWQPGVVPGEFALEWRAVASTAANDVNTASAPGYALAHLRWRAQFKLGPTDALEVLARVDNLFDRVHAGSVIVNDGNQRFFEPGAPRNGLLSVRWQHRW